MPAPMDLPGSVRNWIQVGAHAVVILVTTTPTIALETQSNTLPIIASPCPSRAQIRLVGTTSDGGRSRAIVLEDASGKQSLLNLNDEFAGFRVSHISRDAVTLTGIRCNGELVLTTHAGRSHYSTSSLTNSLVFDSTNSTRIATVREESAFERLGLTTGDVLTAINNEFVRDKREADILLTALHESTLESVAVRRDGHTVVFVNPLSDRFRTFNPVFLDRAPVVDDPPIVSLVNPRSEAQ